MRSITADQVYATLRPTDAVTAIRAALRSGFEPSSDIRRTMTDVEGGQLLFMPSQVGDAVGAKLLSVAPGNPDRDLPRIQGFHVRFRPDTLTPEHLIDGVALTNLRTPAVSMTAVAPVLMHSRDDLTVAVFGAGPQGLGHVAALRDVLGHRRMKSVTYIVRNPDRASVPAGASAGVVVPAGCPAAGRAVEDADVIVCATGSATPVFDSAATKSNVVVIAVGSHDPDRREVDSELPARAQVVVECRATALRECGDVVMAIDDGALTAEDLIELSAICTGTVELDPRRAVFFKSAGMSWEDVVVAEALATRL